MMCIAVLVLLATTTMLIQPVQAGQSGLGSKIGVRETVCATPLFAEAKRELAARSKN